MSARGFRLFTILALVASSALAQRTWVVSQYGGQGVDFTDLPPAFAAAKHGDTIRVRAGSYQPVTTGLGVRLLGEPGATILTKQASVFEVTGVPAGRMFVMKDVAIDVAGIVRLTSNAGAVVLENVLFHQLPQPLYRPSYGIEVLSSAQVSLNRVYSGALKVESSRVSASGSWFFGRDAHLLVYNQHLLYRHSGSPGVQANASTLLFSHCVVTGGNGAYHPSARLPPSFYQLQPVIEPPHAAVRTSLGSLVITGDSASLFKAGLLTGMPTSALSGQGGNVVLDPSVRLVPTGNAPAHGGFGNVYTKRVPCLTAIGAAPGQKLDMELYSPRGHVFVLLASGIGTPVPAQPFLEVWLDPASLMILASGVQDATEHRRIQVPTLGRYEYRGLVLTLQALSGGSFSTATLSPPTHVVIH